MCALYVRVSVICIEFKALMLYAAADNQFVTLAQCFAYQNSIKSATHTLTHTRILMHSVTVAFTWLQLQLEFAGCAALGACSCDHRGYKMHRFIRSVSALSVHITVSIYCTCICVCVQYFCMNYELCKLCTHTQKETATAGLKLCVQWARGT